MELTSLMKIVRVVAADTIQFKVQNAINIFKVLPIKKIISNNQRLKENKVSIQNKRKSLLMQNKMKKKEMKTLLN